LDALTTTFEFVAFNELLPAFDLTASCRLHNCNLEAKPTVWMFHILVFLAVLAPRNTSIHAALNEVVCLRSASLLLMSP
jgi:hypothetical protein